MKAIIENVIKRGDYDLGKILNRIDTYYIESKITEDERDELYSKARNSAKAQLDYHTEIEKLWQKVHELESKIEHSNSTEEDEETTQKIDDWKKPTGAHNGYPFGAIMRYTDGKVYQSVFDGINVWSPEEYPASWIIVEE